MEKIKFEDLPLSSEIQRAVQDMGFTEATPIQAESIPHLLEGVDIVGQAQTGTGKTAAFGIPTAEKVDADYRAVQAIVLCPTRELAMQVAVEFKKLIKYKERLFTLTVYGGVAIDPQIKNLKKGVQIVIGTPGRVIDLIKRRALDLSTVETVVFDEADEMLNMGFRDDIEFILQQTPKERQTILFSATMPPAILALSKQYMHEPLSIKILKKELTVANIQQFYYEIRSKDKINLMIRLIDYHDLQLMLVFCNTKRMADQLNESLQKRGYKAEALHGDLSQKQRDLVMRKFRQGQINMLIATDVAARGIDVDDVDAVFNYDIPLDDEAYVHRIGRTGRAGRVGKAFNFVTGRKELYKLQDIQRYTKGTIEVGIIPQKEDLLQAKQEKLVKVVQQTIQESDLAGLEEMVQTLLDTDFPPESILAALLKIHLGETPRYAEINASPAKGEKKGSDKGKKRKRTKRPRNTDMTRLFFNVGRDQRVSPGDILGAILGETGLRSHQVGDIDIYDKYTFVDIDPKEAAKVIKVMKKNKVKGNAVNVELAE
ncbi:MAG: DEAD/DEAH box helicase [Thermonemataceae bacterium]